LGRGSVAGNPSRGPGTISSKFPLIAVNTASLTSSTKLQFTIASGSGSTAVNCDFTADPNVGSAETLARQYGIHYHRRGSQLSYVDDSDYGLIAGITLTDNAASQLFKLTSGSKVTVTGAALAFPTQLSGIQVSFSYTETTVSPPAAAVALAPLMMISSNQINTMGPFEVAAGNGYPLSLRHQQFREPEFLSDSRWESGHLYFRQLGYGPKAPNGTPTMRRDWDNSSLHN
jgi:hypothetical protein